MRIHFRPESGKREAVVVNPCAKVSDGRSKAWQKHGKGLHFYAVLCRSPSVSSDTTRSQLTTNLGFLVES